MRSCRLLQCCETPAEERSAVNPHATFCGNRRRATASCDPVAKPEAPPYPDRSDFVHSHEPALPACPQLGRCLRQSGRIHRAARGPILTRSGHPRGLIQINACPPPGLKFQFRSQAASSQLAPVSRCLGGMSCQSRSRVVVSLQMPSRAWSVIRKIVRTLFPNSSRVSEALIEWYLTFGHHHWLLSASSPTPRPPPLRYSLLPREAACLISRRPRR